MTKNLNNQNLYLYIPEFVTAVVAIMVKHYNNTPFEAMRAFYKSKTYKKLENLETGFWKKTPEELFDDFQLTHSPAN